MSGVPSPSESTGFVVVDVCGLSSLPLRKPRNVLSQPGKFHWIELNLSTSESKTFISFIAAPIFVGRFFSHFSKSFHKSDKKLLKPGKLSHIVEGRVFNCSGNVCVNHVFISFH